MNINVRLRSASPIKLRYQPGATGPTGLTGPIGPTGPANTLEIGTVTTLPYGEPATANVTGAAPNQTLDLGLPSGPSGGALPQATKPEAEAGTDNSTTITPLRAVNAIAVNLDITRAQIPSRTIGLTYFTVSGFAARGDYGAGASYEREASQDGSGLLAIQDLAGTWFVLVPKDKVYHVGHLGGVGDDSTDDATPLTLAKTLCLANGGKVLLTGQHYSASYIDWTGVPIDALEGATLTGAVDTNKIDKTLRDIPANVRVTGLDFDATVSSRARREAVQKAIWLTGGEASRRRRRYKVLSPGSDMPLRQQVAYPAGDAWADTSAAVGAPPTGGIGLTATTATWDANATNLYMLGIPIHGGQCLQGHFQTAGSYGRCAVVRTTTNGYFMIMADAPGSVRLEVKTPGNPIVQTTIGITYGGTTLAYAPSVSRWEIEVQDYRTVRFKLNGQDLTGPVDLGNTEIEYAGFGVVPTAGPVVATVEYMTLVNTTESTGRQPCNIIVYGDSQSSPRNGDITFAMREALDGSNGFRMGYIVNRAVAGSTTTDVLAAITANGVAGARYVVVSAGVNDQQVGASISTVESNISSIIGIITAGFAKPVVVIEPRYLTRTDGNSTGQNTANSDSALDYRGAIINTAASLGAIIVDLNEVVGPVVAGGIAGGAPIEEDNIHLSVYGKLLAGYAIAEAIIASEAPLMTAGVPSRSMPDRFSNGWSGTTQYPTYSVMSSGDSRLMLLGGVMDAGTTTDGTLVYTLPAGLRPTLNLSFPVRAAGGASLAVLTVSTNGAVNIWNWPGGGAYINLDGISFELAS